MKVIKFLQAAIWLRDVEGVTSMFGAGFGWIAEDNVVRLALLRSRSDPQPPNGA